MNLNEVSQTHRKLIQQWIWQSSIFIIVFAAFLFLLAGSWNWTWGWILVFLLTLFLIGHPVLLIPRSPGLLAERARGIHVPGTKVWDRWVTMITSFFWFSSWLLAALDHRLGWSPAISLLVHCLGAAAVAAGFSLFLWALTANRYFAEGVRIQSERGHSVCDRGPYRFVRHPGYLGNLISGLGSSLLLGSYWSFIPALLGAAGFILRTAWEDETLLAELTGYREYAEKTRYRLIPGLW